MDKPVSVIFIDNIIYVGMEDGAIIANPLDWHPWLANASPAQRENFKLHPYSIYWPDLDEGLDIEGMKRDIQSRK